MKQIQDNKHFENHKYYHKYYLDGEQVTCDLCDVTLPKNRLSQHKMRKHIDKNGKKFVCEHCPYATYLKELLSDHVKRKHFNIPTISVKEEDISGLCDYSYRIS